MLPLIIAALACSQIDEPGEAKCSPPCESGFVCQGAVCVAETSTSTVAVEPPAPPTPPRAPQVRDPDLRNPDREPAQRPQPVGPAFGDAEQFFINAGFSAGLSHTAYSGERSSRTSVFLAPSFGYFVVKNFALSLATGLSYGTDDYIGEIELSARGGAHYNVRLSSSVSLFPGLALGYSYLDTDFDGFVDGGIIFTEQDRHMVTILISAPVLFHPVEHFFFGVGPYVQIVPVLESHGFTVPTKPTTFYIALSIGGWL